MKCIKARLPALLLVAVLLTGVAFGLGQAMESLKVDLARLDGVSAPRLVVSVVSVQKMFRATLTPNRFEEHLKAPGPDYVLHVVSPERVKRIAHLIASLKLSETGTGERIDIRYKFEFTSAGTQPLTFLVGRGGDLVYEGKALHPQENDQWLATFWSYADKDFTYSVSRK